MFTTWGGRGSVVFAIGVPIVVAMARAVSWDQVGPYLITMGAFLLAAFILQALLVPRQLEREQRATYEATIDGLQRQLAMHSPNEVIKRINGHLYEGRVLGNRLRSATRGSTDEEWTVALRDCVDWVYKLGELVNESCIGKADDYVALRRSIPPAIRNAGREPDGSPLVTERNQAWRQWISTGSDVLRDCIVRIEARGP
jgi:hypothetical protein